MTPLLTAFAGTPEKNQVYNLDLFELCAAMPSQSVDMILCDLPYGTTACSWDTIIPFAPMWAAFKRIIKPRGAIVLTASQPFTSALVMSNPKWFRSEWVWDKVRPAGFQLAGVRQLMQHENILVFGYPSIDYHPQTTKRNQPMKGGEKKGSELLTNKLKPKAKSPYLKFPTSIITFAKDDEGLHPTQKPVDLFRYLIRTYTEVGQVVFDPCVGSGTTAIAAREEGRSFIVGDSSLEYVEIARARLAAPYTPSFMPQLELAG